MVKVAMFQRPLTDLRSLQSEVNDWLEVNRWYELVDIKFVPVDSHVIACVIYEVEE
jgi:hypothetical protein